jgi:predicted metal-dependent hydrolase
LEHQDHSTQFWNCVDDLAEDLEYGKNWLKKNGRYLNQYI